MSRQYLSITLWDSWIRLFHWSLVISIFFLLISGKTGTLFFEWHKQVGELVLGLILFRILWSLLGSSNASLSSLFVNPRLAFSHLIALTKRQVPPHRRHNAAGGWAVILMLLSMSFQAISGMLIADEDELLEGRFYGLLNESLSNQLLHLHHLNSGFLIALIVMHVIMIILYKLWAKQNLLTPMITGKIQWPSDQPVPGYAAGKWWVGVVLLILVTASLGYLVKWW